MSPNQWLLVEYIDEYHVVPRYGVVNVAFLVDDEMDVYPGRVTFIKAKHGSNVTRAQILRVSENKWQVKEQKLLMERQDKQMQNMLAMCMRTIKEMRTEPTVYGSSQQCLTEPSGSGVIPAISHERDSSSDSEDEQAYRPISRTKKCSTKPRLVNITDNHTKESVESVSHTERKRRALVCSTPLPPHRNDPLKLTSDKTTQTDEINLGPPALSAEKMEQFETILRKLYAKFLKLVGDLQIDLDEHVLMPNGELNGVAESDREYNIHEHLFEDALNNSDIDSRALQVRRVSANTTNSEEHDSLIDDDMVPIGSGNARVPARLLNDLDWDSYSTATRKLLQAIFPRKVLATHSLTGKQSPAFANKPAKKRLDPILIDDIIEEVSKRCEIPKRLVRSCITIKCTDEAKLFRNRMLNRSNLMELGSPDPENQENVPPSPAALSRNSSNESY